MKKIYFVGKPISTKGIEDFNYLADRILQAEFYFFCYKTENSIIKKYPKINFIIGLNDEEMKEKIKNEMDLMISCSRFEGFCLPIAEAMMLKKPVLSYKLDELKAVYLDNIEYIECFDIKKFEQRLDEIIKNDNYNRDLDRARDFIIENYSPESVSKKLLNILLI
jgi:glycosyltransferase involved in cell wall biosynthesis